MYKIKIVMSTGYKYYYCRTNPNKDYLCTNPKDATEFTDATEIINEIKSIPIFKTFKSIEILKIEYKITETSVNLIDIIRGK